MDVLIYEMDYVDPARRPFEIVERKGIGHPDTLADGLAEVISCDYSEFCRQNFGVILHQMLDKISISGGRAELSYGHSKMLEPWRLYVNGRISSSFGDTPIDYERLVTRSVHQYLSKSVPYFDVAEWLKIIFTTSTYSRNPHWFRPRGIGDVPDATLKFANDTSAAVGFWPLTITEQLTLFLEGCFYDEAGAPRNRDLGQDIKVMSIRKGDSIDVTLTIPFMCIHIPNREAYCERKKEISGRLTQFGREFLGDRFRLSVTVNAVDSLIDQGGGIGQYFFVASGSSLDSGEEGVVGRGNRSRGFSSSVRPNTFEGIHGKNPVYYAGKVYNYMADILSKKLAEHFACSCVVYIISRNGDTLSCPHQLFVETSRPVSHKTADEMIQETLSVDAAERILSERPFVPVAGGGHGFRAHGVHSLI